MRSDGLTKNGFEVSLISFGNVPLCVLPSGTDVSVI
jgi:hypothetical protein